MAHTNYRKLSLWKRPAPSVFMIPTYSGSMPFMKNSLLTYTFSGVLCLGLILALPHRGRASEVKPASGPLPTEIKSIFIRSDTVWEGRVVVDGIIKVSEKVTLTIKPGTKVLFTRRDTNGDGLGEHALYLQGRLIARGTAEQPIIFSSAEERPRPGDWDGIHLIVSEEFFNVIEHCELSYAYRAVHSHFSALKLKYNTFIHNWRGVYFKDMKAELLGNRFIDNRSGVRGRESDLILRDNIFSGNYWGMDLRRSRITAMGNKFEGQLLHGLRLRQVEGRLAKNEFTANRYGLRLLESKLLLIDNKFHNNQEIGLALFHTELELENNRFEGNFRAAVSVRASTLRAKDNMLIDNGDGFQLREAKLSFLVGNHIMGNGLVGISAQASSLALRENNISDNREGIRVKNTALLLEATQIYKNRQAGLSAEGGQVFVWRNIIRHNGEEGVSVKSANITLEGNKIHDNRFSGIKAEGRSTVSLRQNFILNNAEAGLELEEGDLLAYTNTIRGNKVGMQLKSSGSIILEGNRIEANKEAGIMAEAVRGSLWGNAILNQKGDGLLCSLSELTMKDNQFLENQGWAVHDRYSRLNLEKNHLANNGGGINLDHTEAAIIWGCRIQGNRREGILSAGTEEMTIGNNHITHNEIGVALDTQANLIGNNITENRKYAVSWTGRQDLEAPGNWWGAADPDLIRQKIFDQEDDHKSGELYFEPIANQPWEHNEFQTKPENN